MRIQSSINPWRHNPVKLGNPEHLRPVTMLHLPALRMASERGSSSPCLNKALAGRSRFEACGLRVWNLALNWAGSAEFSGIWFRAGVAEATASGSLRALGI